MEVMTGSHYQEGYISFYLNREFLELNLSVFKSIFDFPPSIDLPYQHVPEHLTRMHFGMNFRGFTGMTQATLKALSLGTPIFE